MVISKNSQLGLGFSDNEVKIRFFTIMKNHLETQLNITDTEVKKLNNWLESIDNGDLTEEIIEDYNQSMLQQQNTINQLSGNKEIRDNVSNYISHTAGLNMMTKDDSKYFLICESVYKAAELIKVNTGFTGRTLKDINFGTYTYLMGRNEMVRFIVSKGGLKGYYFDDLKDIAFEFGIEMEYGNYYFQDGYDKLFSKVMQILTFVELGDIEIVELLKGRNNGGKKDKEKVTNTSNNTVFVVDSSWNKLIIRTEGFAVRGHFRLQPCGVNHADRTLIWINAFEKHGFTRKPKAEIIR